MLLQLMKMVFDYATLVLRANDLCITINPRHNDFYKRYLLFAELGGLKSYPSVANNPAFARRLDLDSARLRCEGHDVLLRLFFEERTEMETFETRYRMTPEDMAFFAEKTSVVSDASEKLLAVVEQEYPQLPWSAWRNPAPGIQGSASQVR